MRTCAITVGVIMGLLFALFLVGLWWPFYGVGGSSAGDVPLSAPHPATSMQKERYGVSAQTIVLGELTPSSTPSQPGVPAVAIHYRRYALIAKCSTADGHLQVQETYNFRRWLRRQREGGGRSAMCPTSRMPDLFHYSDLLVPRRDARVIIEVIEACVTQTKPMPFCVRATDWGVLIVEA